MAFQLVSFPQRSDRVCDWTRDELAELYRIEHALAQANIRSETDRGLSDEGDPWFVFCRSDGEVLVHITRYDGQYWLSSPGLESSLVGRSFAELTKNFVRQVPVQVSLQQRGGAKLFVHPAAMLAVIVGTLFAASNDLHLFSSRNESGQHDDGGSVKHTLQANFASYIETFFYSMRDASIFQPSSYLALISGVAAFIIESTFGITGHSANEIANANVVANDTRSAEGTSEHDNASSVADNQISGHKLAVNEHSAAIATTETAAQENIGNAGGPNALHEVLAVNGAQITNIHVAENDDALSTKAIDNVLNVNDFSAEDNAGHIARPAVFVPVLNNLNSSNFGSYTTNGTHSGFGPDPSQSDASPQTNTFNTDVIGLLTNAINSPNENMLFNSIFSNIGHVVTDTSTVTAAANTVASSISGGAAPQQIPIFDAAAEATLIAFFEANPNPQTVFYHGNIIVSDGIQSATDSVIVKIWEVGTSGETIAIVGHVDHGLTA